LNSRKVVNTTEQAELFTQALALKMSSLKGDALTRFTKDAIVSVVRNFAGMQVKLHLEGE